MLRGRISRRNISICAFCQHRLSLRLATPRYRPFSSTRNLTSNGPSSSGWGAFGAQKINNRPPGAVAGGSWGAPAFAPRKVPPAAPTPAPQDSGQRQSEPGASAPQSSSTSTSASTATTTTTTTTTTTGPSTDIKPARQPAPKLILNEHELRAREKLLAREIALEKAQQAQLPQQPQARFRFGPARQLAIEQTLRHEKKDLLSYGNMLRKPAASTPPLFDAVDFGLGKTRGPGLGKLANSGGFWNTPPPRTADANDTKTKTPFSERPAPRTPNVNDIKTKMPFSEPPKPRTTDVNDIKKKTPFSEPPAPRTTNVNDTKPKTLFSEPLKPQTADVNDIKTKMPFSEPPKPRTTDVNDIKTKMPFSEPPAPRTTNVNDTKPKTLFSEPLKPQTADVNDTKTKTLFSEPPKKTPVSSWGLMGQNTIQKIPHIAAWESRLNRPAGPPARSTGPAATNNGNATSGGRDSGVESTSASPINTRTGEKADGWGMLARKNKPVISSSDGFWDSLETAKPSNPISRQEKGPTKPDDDWGREFDSNEYQRTIKPQPPAWSAKESTAQSTEQSIAQPTPVGGPSPSPSTAGERVVGAQRTQDRDQDKDDRMKRFNKGGKTERDSKKRPNRASRYEQEEYEDEEERNRYTIYQERQRQKEERKARREAERAGPVPILIPDLISITALADALKIRHDEFLSQLGELGFEDVTLDSLMAGETAALVAQEYGFEPTIDTGKGRDLIPRPPPEDPSVLPSRPPVVTIMGHVDHGKTTLLDYLRKSSVAAQEHGGITQHIGAFSVKLSTGKPITFLDTPGHAAFLTMRQRGAIVTDIVVLVVAADDSVMPQTLEALKHAQAAKVPIIVAITKIDRDGAQIDRVKSDLATVGVEIEDYGGDVQAVCVSGKTGEGMEQLEDAILTLSEILDHRAEVDGQAEGWVLESSLKLVGKVATVLVKRGTLRPGDYVAAGLTWAKIRHLRNEAGVLINEAPPGTAVEIMGWKDLPAAGDSVIQSPDDGRAKDAVTYRKGLREREKDAAAHEIIAENRRALQEKRAREKKNKADAKGEPEAIEEEEEAKGPKIVNFVVKGDVHGSVEAVCAAILEVGNHEVLPRILRSATGPVTQSDVEHAATSQSVIVNFATTPQGSVRQLAKDQKVRILDHNIIYRVVEDVCATLSEQLAPDVTSRVLGEAEVLQVFPINIIKRIVKNIAGCRVRHGIVRKNCLYRVLRKDKKVFEGKLESLKQHKHDAEEVRNGSECGMGFEEFQDFEVGDTIQAYEEVVTPRKLPVP